MIILSQQLSPLTVSEDTPRDPTVQQLRDADLARERAIRLVEDVLRGDLDALAQILAREEQIKRGRAYDDLCYFGSACEAEVSARRRQQRWG